MLRSDASASPYFFGTKSLRTRQFVSPNRAAFAHLVPLQEQSLRHSAARARNQNQVTEPVSIATFTGDEIGGYLEHRLRPAVFAAAIAKAKVVTTEQPER